MLVVVAFCSKDAGLQRKNLEWCLELDSGCGREGVLSYDSATAKEDVQAIEKLARQYFTKVHHCQYFEPPVKGWPAACNWAWQSTARWMMEANLKQPWLWLEADAMPLRSGWVGAIEEGHRAGGKSFAGHIVKDMWHMNGVGVYPWDVAIRNEMAMLARAAAWDVVLKPNILNDCTNLNHLIQHAWNVHPTDRNMIWNGEGTPLTFRDDSDVDRYMDFNAVLLHRVKDGSLIHFLRERKHAEEKRIEEEQRLINSTEYNVPQHTSSVGVAAIPGDAKGIHPVGEGALQSGNVGDVQEITMGGRNKTEILTKPLQHEDTKVDSTGTRLNERNDGELRDSRGLEQDGQCSPEDNRVPPVVCGATEQTAVYTGGTSEHKVYPKTEILIVTYGLPTKRQSGLVVSDFDWLAWCLRSIRRWCFGFSGVTVAFPDRDAGLFLPISKEHADSGSKIPLRVKLYSEKDGKGHIQHMSVMGRADEFVPKGTTHVLHVDADCIFRADANPSCYINGDKPIYVVRTYESLLGSAGQRVSDCYQWRQPTAEQLGFDPEMYTMCIIPACFPIGFYPKYREHIEKQHGMPYVDYMLSGRNEHPATRMDFTAMGAFAWKFMHDQFDWRDISEGNHLAPREYHKNFWSHGGLPIGVVAELGGIIAP